jgi:hypothetical protein
MPSTTTRSVLCMLCMSQLYACGVAKTVLTRPLCACCCHCLQPKMPKFRAEAKKVDKSDDDKRRH